MYYISRACADLCPFFGSFAEIIDGVKCYSFSTTTCFGAASSADVFHDLGSAAEFILRMAAGKVVICRYADDFIVFTPPTRGGTDFPHADRARARIIGVCDALGLPSPNSKGRHLNSFSSVQAST